MARHENEHGLTPKQEAFCLAFHETGIGAEAYRRAYDVKAATTHSTIYVAASELLANPKIKVRIADLQRMSAELSLYTVRQAFDEYEAARKLAMAEGIDNPSAAVSAINGKVKLFGLEAPAKSKIDHTSSDGTMTPKALDLSNVSDAALREIMAAMNASPATDES